MDARGLFTTASHGDICQMNHEPANGSSNGLHEEEAWAQARDDVTGTELDPSFVKMARFEGIEYFKKMGYTRKESCGST